MLAEQVSLDLIYSVLGFSSENEAMYWMVGTFLCEPTPFNPRHPRLQPHASRLQPHASCPQPHAHVPSPQPVSEL